MGCHYVHGVAWFEMRAGDDAASVKREVSAMAMNPVQLRKIGQKRAKLTGCTHVDVAR